MENIQTKEDAINALNLMKQDFDKRECELRKVIEGFDKCSKLTYKDVTDINVAEEVLKDLKCGEHIKFTENQFCRKIDWVSYKLETMIKAVNYLDNNNKIWIKDFTNQNEYYYTPYFYMGDGVFSYNLYRNWCTYSHVGFGRGFKNKDTMLHCVKMWLNDYKFYHTGK